ncbi:12615_t:CDS:2, partial [Funneliformis geosporum]
PNCGNGINDPCKIANATLALCDGQLPPIPPEALSGAEPFNYDFEVECPGVTITVDTFETFAKTCFNEGYYVNNLSPSPKKDCNTPNDPCKAVNETLTNCG